MNWIFGDNINTDLITPGRYNITTDPKALAAIAFIEHEPAFAKEVKKGDFVIGGNNFGCGSSRETAPMALLGCHIRAVVAKSFARIFYRNCMNQGLLAIIADTDNIGRDDVLTIDIENQRLINTTTGERIPADIPKAMVTLHEHGGIIEYIKQHGIDSLEALFSTQ